MSEKDQTTEEVVQDSESDETQEATPEVEGDSVQETLPEAEPSADDELAALAEENARLKDLYLRSAAELKNQSIRNAEAIEKAHKFAVEKFAKNLLPVMDSLEKALEAASAADEATKAGIEATIRQFISALDASGLTSINPVGEKFDPALHQALTMVEAPEGIESGCVAQVFQRGWLLNGRVLRAAMVAVAK